MTARSAILCIAVGLWFGPIPASAQADQGVTSAQITIGMSTALQGPTSFLGTNFRLGVETYLNAANSSGGILGRKLRLIAYDDGYEPSKAVANVKKLITDDGVFCLLGNVGTPTALAVRPILNAEKVFLFAPFTGAESLRTPPDPQIIHYRASYNQEAEVMVQGAVDSLGFSKIAVFYQDDGYGKAVLAGATSALAKRGLKPVALGSYTRNFENVYNGLGAIMAERPQAVIIGGTYSAAAKFITSWKRKSLLEKRKDPDPVFMNVSFVGPDILAKLLDKYGDGTIVTQVVPPWYQQSASYPAVTEYLNAMARFFPKERPSFVGLEGYLATKTFAEVLRRTGKDLTRAGFLRTVESIKDLDIGAGNVISFSPQNHQGSQTVYPTMIRNGQFYLVTDWKAVTQ